MNARPRNLDALIGSRICHDLISPIGAIGNGLELLSLTQAANGPEMAMISESVANAQARIRFYRVAYGASSADQSMASQEARDILADLYAGSRVSVDWTPGGELRREDAKLAFLLLQCLESALPRGGEIRVTRSNSAWEMTGTAGKQRFDPDLWSLLTGATPTEDLQAAQIQFALAPLQAADMGRMISYTRSDEAITLRF